MDDPELFDVFNVDNNTEPLQRPVQSVPRDMPNKSVMKELPVNGVQRKRSYDGLTANGNRQGINGGDVFHISKKPRKNEENPIVVDSFESESDQVVPATHGLQGIVPTDQNIVIKKRVSPFLFHLMFSIVMPLYSPLRTGNIPDWNRISFWILLREVIHSNLIPSRRCQ